MRTTRPIRSAPLMPRLSVALLCAAILTPGAAWAQREFVDLPERVSPTTESAAPMSASTWYGYQVFVADGAAVLFATGAFSADSATMGVISVGLYGLGGPAIHLARGNYLRAAGSLALRAGLPIVGVLIGKATANCPDGKFLCGLGNAGYGAIVGLAGASLADALFLAWDSEPEPRHSEPSRLPALTFNWIHGTPTLRVNGTF